ncbi:hypothetical protein [Candidatus Bodocaedibacter vickermanii]|uniref:Uncharacterized protein n=1 Tax=Candidatus Bodocaedibacter vickermanii TaxID=2741701 RepID=A0A7L9RUW6_9PROT|nr:hypothetical protein CPBP_01148 [Candidatus Paracaedibacteraceae bacterium 'Lake Konstanz']
MKKLYILFSYVACLSSTFAAVLSPSSDFDDCDEQIKPGYVEPHTTPQAGPQAGAAADSLMQLLLPEVDQSDAVKEDQVDQPQTLVVEIELQSPKVVGTLVVSLDLKIYYSERDGDEISLKRFTQEVLTADYAVLNPGSTVEFLFIPDIKLHVVGGCCTEGRVSFFDTMAWSANVRAWSKWWLNFWAWWNPSRYVLDNTSDKVEWDSITSRATIRISTQKDITYLASQLRLFLLQGWSSKFAPYIAPVTREVLARAVMLRFETVEKPALEATGFKNVVLSTRINPVTSRLERIIRATK